MSKATLLSVLILLGVVTLTLLPLFKPGLFDVHDPTSAFRLYALVETIKSGQFPASWSNELNFGFGYPLHLYYAPLFTYLGALFYFFTQSYEVAIKLALVLTSLLGTFGIYRLSAQYGHASAMLASIAYTLLPYRASALFVRGSYSEFLAMSLIPWLIYFWLKPQKGKGTLLATAITTALFVLSHNTLHLLVLPIIILMIILYQRQNWRGVLSSLLLSLGLSAWFILPVIFERSFIQVDSVARITNFQDHFLTLSQLWYSPWGYGGSSPGPNDLMSFMVGKGQLVLGFVGLVYLAWQKSWQSLMIFGTLSFVAIFLSLENSQFVWSSLPLLTLMQFPWRTLALLGLGISALAGYSVQILPAKLQLPATIIVALLLLSTNLNYFKPQEYRTYNQDIVSNAHNLDPLARDKFPEYLPAQMPTFPDARADDGLRRTATKVSGQLSLEQAKPITISTAYMPHWQLRVNDQSVDITHTETGLISTIQAFEPGDYQLELNWHRTPLEQLANIISLLSLLVVIGLLLV